MDVSVYRGLGQGVWENGQVAEAYKVNTVRSRAGLLLNTEKFYVGYSVHLVDRFVILPQNDTALSFSVNRFEKFNSYWQLGYTFGNNPESKFSCTPQLVFRLGTRRYVGNGRASFHPVDFHVNFRYQKFIWGVNLTGVHVGWQMERLRIVLSDSLGYLWESGYAANIALRFQKLNSLILISLYGNLFPVRMASFFRSGLVRSSFLLAFTSFAAFGQQTTNLPLGALPMQYNGSFAGEAGSPRISSNFGFGHGWGYRQGGYYRGAYHQQVSYDQFVPALSTGIGVGVQAAQYDMFSRQRLGGFSVAVAPKISLKGKYTLSPSLSLEYAAVHAPTRNVTFNDTSVVSYGYNSKNLLGRAGLLFNTSKFYVGYSVDIMDHWVFNSFNHNNGLQGTRRLDRFSSYLQMGYTFRKNPESHFSITPQVAFYIGHGGFVYKNTYERFGINLFQGYNVTFRYRQFIWGVNNMGLHAGWQARRLKVMASNAVSFEGGFHWHHAANISLRYVFRNDKG